MENSVQKDFKEFEDYLILSEQEALNTKLKDMFYLKVLDKDKQYLGSIKIGILKSFTEKEIKSLIDEVLDFNFPLWNSYDNL